MVRSSVNLLKAQVLLSLGLLTAGLLLPCIKVDPRMGDYTGLIKAFNPTVLESTELSIASGIMKLLSSGEFFIGIIILVFSVLFPYAKLAVLWNAAINITDHGDDPRVALAGKLGKYSMLDVLVMALLVLCLKGLPGDSSVSLRVGAYLFCVSILISMFVPFQIEKLKKVNNKPH